MARIEAGADGVADGLEADEARTVVTRTRRIRRHAEPLPTSSPRSRRLRAKVQRRLDRLDDQVTNVIEGTRGRARAVAESARRGKQAPRKIGSELREWGQSVKRAILANVVYNAIGGILAVGFVIALSIGGAQGLNRLLGVPWGTLIVAGVYGIAAAIVIASGRAKARKNKVDAKRHAGNIRSEVAYVGEPLQVAFRKRPSRTKRIVLEPELE